MLTNGRMIFYVNLPIWVPWVLWYSRGLMSGLLIRELSMYIELRSSGYEGGGMVQRECSCSSGC